ncbi:Tripartite motif-containing protein 3 [Geodia barretti]|uniref:Tripartite motif-containing protein 3 n=1 Tax=Geodia barretti TaxID=519541 RepID=A0AA35WCT7_GEOBA|nr:Tripartite motif-containing protein 3 [Geodia barretti]
MLLAKDCRMLPADTFQGPFLLQSVEVLGASSSFSTRFCYNRSRCSSPFTIMAERPTKLQDAPKRSENPAQQALEKLSNQLSCSVCLEEYRRPRVLPCLHVFCEACLEKLVGTQRDKLSAPCPNCRKTARLPEGGVSSLPYAFYINHLFEVREVLEKVSNPEKAQCDKCGEGEVQGFCRDCGQFICQLCLTMHGKWKELQGHEISTIDEVQETASKMVTPKKVSSTCSKHATEPTKIYCETCDELICRDCTVKTHRDHNYDLVPDAFPKHRDAILASLGPVKSELASVGSTIAQLKARSSRLDERGVEAQAEVNAVVDKLQAILEARRRELHSQIDGEVCQGKKELAARIDGHELRQAQLSSCVDDSFGSRGSEVGQFKYPDGITVNKEGNVLIADRENSRVQVFDSNGHHLSSITHTGAGEGLRGPVSVAVGPDDWVYVVECDCPRVSVFDEDCKYIKSFGKRGEQRWRVQ